MTALAATKISSKGQVVIPGDICRCLKLKPGSLQHPMGLRLKGVSAMARMNS